MRKPLGIFRASQANWEISSPMGPGSVLGSPSPRMCLVQLQQVEILPGFFKKPASLLKTVFRIRVENLFKSNLNQNCRKAKIAHSGHSNGSNLPTNKDNPKE